MKITITDKKKALQKTVRVSLNHTIAATRYCTEGREKIMEYKVPKKADMTRRQWIVMVRGIVQEAQKQEVERIGIVWSELTDFPAIGDDLSRTFAEAVYMAQYQFRKYKKRPEKGWKDLAEVVVFAKKSDKTCVKKECAMGVTIATQINFCRDLANISGADMTPTMLVSAVRKAIKGTKIKMRVLNEQQMQKKKMNGVLTVGKGSAAQSRFMILEYAGTKQNQQPTVLVGKGVTYDSGGIDTKPHPHGLEMMMDMSGAAAVIATICAVAKLRISQRVVALVPLVENMPSGSSMRPGDVITMMDGTHVEIGHTDAEGRLILADALTFAKSFNPKCVIDVATLTGAALVALGERASAIFTDNEELAQRTCTIGEKRGDYVWRLPLWEEYATEIAGTRGDIANIRTKGQPGAGGTITAAMFLRHFAKDYQKNWMHIDIAPTMTAVFDENLAKGAKGSPVRLLVELLR